MTDQYWRAAGKELKRTGLDTAPLSVPFFVPSCWAHWSSIFHHAHQPLNLLKHFYIQPHPTHLYYPWIRACLIFPHNFSFQATLSVPDRGFDLRAAIAARLVYV